MRDRQWLGSAPQRIGTWVLSKIEPEHLGPTTDSYRPRAMPWIFRGYNGDLTLVVVCLVLLAWIWR